MTRRPPDRQAAGSAPAAPPQHRRLPGQGGHGAHDVDDEADGQPVELHARRARRAHGDGVPVDRDGHRDVQTERQGRCARCGLGRQGRPARHRASRGRPRTFTARYNGDAKLVGSTSATVGHRQGAVEPHVLCVEQHDLPLRRAPDAHGDALAARPRAPSPSVTARGSSARRPSRKGKATLTRPSSRAARTP